MEITSTMLRQLCYLLSSMLVLCQSDYDSTVKCNTIHEVGGSEENSDSGKYEDTRVTYPHVVDGRGIRLSDISQRSRKRRSIQYINSNLKLTLRTIAGPLTFHLEPAQHLLSPNARVEVHSKNITHATKIQQHCLHIGNTRTNPTYSAMFNLCNGVKGYAVAEHRNIYVRPVGDNSSGFNKPHYVVEHSFTNATSPTLHGLDLPQSDFKGSAPTHPGRNSSRGSKHKRRKRSTYKGPRYMGLMLVTDTSVSNFHGNDLIQQYLLTQMHIVNKVYHHPTLGVEINVIVVKIVILDDETADTVVVKEDGKKTLDEFCRWSSKERTKDDFLHENVDVAIYTTRRNIGPAGYAPVWGICNKLRSCSVSKDDGISSSFVIAHEIGHILGMIHDGSGNDCDADPTDGKLMAARVQSSYGKYYWSTCSRDVIERNLHKLHCLRNKPVEGQWPRYSQPYGESWSVDEQCRQEFGSGFSQCTAFNDLDPCQYLWCSSTEDRSICKTKKATPLPGTACGATKWCMDGECTQRDNVDVNGNWASWSDWGECSRTCNTGIRYRYRTCTDPAPVHGGRRCHGKAEEFRLCNTQACGERTDFRAEQCTMHNDKTFTNNRRHHWLPLENKNISKICKLTCVSQETKDVIVTDEDVVDGTFCSYEMPQHICVKGKCIESGCDGILKSGSREDRCGVCQGISSSCKEISGTFHKNVTKKEYHKVLSLPSKTRSILIQERHSTPHLAHFISMRDKDSHEFILNGGDHQEHSRQFVAHGTRFVYLSKKDGESLTARGPLLDPIEIMVYSMSSKLPTTIEYSYLLPVEMENAIDNEVETDHERYIWQQTSWTTCSKSCGEGIQSGVYICLDRITTRKVTPGLCSLKDKPRNIINVCNEGPCFAFSYRWLLGEWSPCSVSCGRKGVRKRQVHCIKSVDGVNTEMDPNFCSGSGDPPGEETRKCHTRRCPAKWRTRPWTKCSAKCGGGKQKRKVNCNKPRDGKKYKCYGKKPADKRRCNVRPCRGNKSGERDKETVTTTVRRSFGHKFSVYESTTTTTATTTATTTTTTTTTTPTTTIPTTTTIALETTHAITSNPSSYHKLFTIPKLRESTPQEAPPGETSTDDSTSNDTKSVKPQRNKVLNSSNPDERRRKPIKDDVMDEANSDSEVPEDACVADTSIFCPLGASLSNCLRDQYNTKCCKSCKRYRE